RDAISVSLGRHDAGRSDEAGTHAVTRTARTHSTAPHRGAEQSASEHQISRRAAGWAVGRCQAGLGGEYTHVDVTPGAPSPHTTTANQENHAPTRSGGIEGMRPLSAEMPPSVQCASHRALLAEGSSASQAWPWSCRVSVAAATKAAGVPGRSRHS